MSRLVCDNKRYKKVWQMPLKEFKEGEWLQDVPDSDLSEVNYKSGFLTINDAELRRVGSKDEKSEEDKDE